MVNNSLAIIIPVFHGQKQLRKCLQALLSGSNTRFEIILVDHGPDDTISQHISACYPKVTCLRGSPELWWSGATNLGIRHALDSGKDLIMLLNHDCYVQQNTIEQLLASIAPSDNAVIAPMQHHLQADKDVIGATSCLLLGFSTLIPPASWYRHRYSTTRIPTQLILGGRGAIIRSGIFLEVGLFDEANLPHYGADHDFYFRCRKHGVKLLVDPSICVDIDDTQTTAAAMATNLSIKGFYKSLISRSSHRNIRDLYALYTKHFPVPGLAIVGVSMNLLRYSIVYALKLVGQNVKI